MKSSIICEGEAHRMAQNVRDVQNDMRRRLRRMLLSTIAVAEFDCPTCRAKPNNGCVCVMFGMRSIVKRASPHDERVVKAILVYGEGELQLE
jgi:hypothetical protein